MKVEINVWVKVLAVDVKHFVVKVVDELQIVLSHAGHTSSTAHAKGQDKDECNTINLHVLHFFWFKMF